MSEIFNLSALCRCCHSDGCFKSLNLCYSFMGQVEVYANMLHETFGILLQQPSIELSYSICDVCIIKLRQALQFKRQVQECEMKIEDDCKNEMAPQSEIIKIEHAPCSDKMIIPDINIKEDLGDDIQDNEDTNADYAHVEVSIHDYIDINEDKTIKTECKLNECLAKQQSHSANTEIQRNVCIEKGTSGVSNMKIRQKNVVKEKSYEPDLSDDSPDDEDTKVEYVDVDISNYDYIGNSEEKIIITEYQLNECLQNQQTSIANTEIQHNVCLEKEQTVNTKSKIQKKSFIKQTSDVSKAKIKQKNVAKEKSNLKSSLDSATTINLTPFHMNLGNPKVYVCQTCKSSFKTLGILREHLRRQHYLFHCRICKKNFNTKEAITIHKSTHRDEIFECDICGKRYPQRMTMISHRNTHTKEVVFTCDMCNKDFLYKSALRKHIAVHLGTNKKFMCDLCGHSFNDITNLKIHVRNVHEKLRLFKCDQCPKTYSTIKTLRIHLRKHTGERPYKCQLCDEAYACSSRLSEHTDRQHSKITYECKICGKHYNSRKTFTSHTRTHIAPKPYHCDYCDQDFTCTFSLNRHMNAHEGKAKKFPCEICLKKFSDKGQLNKHMKTIHDPNKPLQCNEVKMKCNLCKMSVRDMEKHMKTHTDRSLLCSLCPRSYSETSALNRHFREIHCGITHDCDLCDKKYVKAKSLQMHKLKIHNTHSQFKVEQEDENKLGIVISKCSSMASF
ncbi:zinc finger protein ZFP2-like [Maniola hyperantus]|uniref:zinc finger protein ZFP2-like n=1 Tax=Aphantopus hyperantus TaxID=2795564 RepID=UPI003747F22E